MDDEKTRENATKIVDFIKNLNLEKENEFEATFLAGFVINEKGLNQDQGLLRGTTLHNLWVNHKDWVEEQ